MAIARTGVFVDDYLEYSSTLPAELQRLLNTIRELDDRSQAMISQTRQQTKYCLGLASQGGSFSRRNEDEAVSEKIRKEIEANQDNALSLCTEKVLLARQAHDLMVNTQAESRLERIERMLFYLSATVEELRKGQSESAASLKAIQAKLSDLEGSVSGDKATRNQNSKTEGASHRRHSYRRYYLPTFDGTDATAWLARAEKFFLFHRTREDKKIDSHIKRLDEDLNNFAEDLKQEGKIGPDEPAVLPPLPLVPKGEKRKPLYGTPQSKRVDYKERDWDRERDRDFELMPPPGSLKKDFASPVDVDQPIDPNEPTYCVCHQVSFGDMIACDNENCQGGEWFHYECVGLSSETRFKGKWYCPTCSKITQ